MKKYEGIFRAAFELLSIGTCFVSAGCLGQNATVNGMQGQGAFTQLSAATAVTTQVTPSATASVNTSSLYRPAPSAVPMPSSSSSGSTQGQTGTTSSWTLAIDFEPFPGMPYRNQTDPTLANYNYPGTSTPLISASNPNGSELCGPTSASMILAGVIGKIASSKGVGLPDLVPTAYGQPPSVSNWTKTSFLGAADWQTQIANVAYKMGNPSVSTDGESMASVTNVIPGVYLDMGTNMSAGSEVVRTAPTATTFSIPVATVSDFSRFFAGYINGTGINPNGTATSNDVYIPTSAPSNVYLPQVELGYYVARKSVVGTTTTISFVRVGGHFIVFSGYTYSTRTQGTPTVQTAFIAHNPLYSVPQVYQIAVMPSTGTDPVGACDPTQYNWNSYTCNTSLGLAAYTSTLTGAPYIPLLSIPTTVDPTNPQTGDIYTVIEGATGMSAPCPTGGTTTC